MEDCQQIAGKLLNIADFAGKRKKYDDFDEKSVNNANFDGKSPARMSENCQKMPILTET